MRSRLVCILCFLAMLNVSETRRSTALPPSPGATAFVIQVLDEDDQPIVGASVNWFSKDPKVNWQGKTNSDGAAVWDEASGKVAKFHISCLGYLSVQVNIDTSEPFQVVLKKAPIVRGRVLDDLTGNPINEFTVASGRVNPRIPVPLFPLRFTKTEPEGSFTVSIETANGGLNAGMSFVVSALGYESWIREIDEGLYKDEITIRMKKSDTFRGTILKPDGKPADSASVTLLDLSQRVSTLIASRLPIRTTSTSTDAEGRFALDLVEGKSAKPTLRIEHSSGYAQLPITDFDKPISVTLNAWTSLEIIAKRDGQPVANLPLTLAYKRAPGIVTSRPMNAQTNNEGRVTFERLMPLAVDLSVGDPGNVYSNKPANLLSIIRNSGRDLTEQPNQWELNLDGPKVVGKVVIPPDPQGLRTLNSAMSLTITSVNTMGTGRIFFATNEDGTFAVESISPGEYRITATPSIGRTQQYIPVHAGPRQEPLETTFEVAEGQREPVEVVFTLQWPKLLDVGDYAKPFAGRLESGQMIDSKAFIGKWIVLQWYVEDSTECLEQLTELLESYPSWNDAGVEVVSVVANLKYTSSSSSRGLADSRPFVPFAFIKDEVAEPLMSKDYEVALAPTLFLVDPNGKIAYRGSDFMGLKSKVVELVLLPETPTTIGKTHPFAPIRSTTSHDKDFVASKDAAVVLQSNRMIGEPRKDANWSDAEQELTLLTGDGKLVRRVSLGKRIGFSISTSAVIDRKRGRVYATTASGVIALSRRGEILFETPLVDVRELCVDEMTGDLWCGCGDPVFNQVVVLGSNGNELRRIVVSGRDLRYNPVSDTFWSFNLSYVSSSRGGTPTWITVVDRQGETIRELPAPDGTLYVTDRVFDSQGDLWCIGTLSAAIGSTTSRSGHPTVWRYIGAKLEAIATDEGRPFAIEALGDTILVSIASTPSSNANGAKPHVERFSVDGKRLDRVEMPIRAFTVADSGIWLLNKLQVERYTSDFQLLGSFDFNPDETVTGDRPVPVVHAIHAF